MRKLTASTALPPALASGTVATMATLGGGRYPLPVDLAVYAVMWMAVWSITREALTRLREAGVRNARACDCGAENAPHSLDCATRFPQRLNPKN